MTRLNSLKTGTIFQGESELGTKLQFPFASLFPVTVCPYFKLQGTVFSIVALFFDQDDEYRALI